MSVQSAWNADRWPGEDLCDICGPYRNDAGYKWVVLAALTTQIGTLQIAPVAIAVLTGYLAVSGTGTLMALANRAGKAADPTTKTAG